MALYPQQVKAIAYLSEGKGVKYTAETLEVCRATVYKWLKVPEFQASLQEAQKQGLELIRSRIVCLADEALDTVIGVMRDPEASPGLRLKAAIAILDRSGIETEKAAPEQTMSEEETKDVEEYLAWKATTGSRQNSPD